MEFSLAATAVGGRSKTSQWRSPFVFQAHLRADAFVDKTDASQPSGYGTLVRFVHEKGQGGQPGGLRERRLLPQQPIPGRGKWLFRRWGVSPAQREEGSLCVTQMGNQCLLAPPWH
jgi:hypothetical protein